MTIALPGAVCLIHGQSGVPNFAARSGQDFGKKWLWMSMARMASGTTDVGQAYLDELFRNSGRLVISRRHGISRKAAANPERCSSAALPRDAPDDGIFRNTIRTRPFLRSRAAFPPPGQSFRERAAAANGAYVWAAERSHLP